MARLTCASRTPKVSDRSCAKITATRSSIRRACLLQLSLPLYFWVLYRPECHPGGVRLLGEYSENQEVVDCGELYLCNRRISWSRSNSRIKHTVSSKTKSPGALLNHSESGSREVSSRNASTTCPPHRLLRLRQVPEVNLLMLSTGSFGRGIGCHYRAGHVDIGS